MRVRFYFAVLIFAAFALAAWPAPHADAQTLQGDAARGEKLFKKCRACHMVGDKARALVGPPLNNIIGGKIAAVPRYKYSKAMLAFAAEQPIWTPALLDTYLTKPRQLVKGTRMVFVGLKKPTDRADLLAYLAQFTAAQNE